VRCTHAAHSISRAASVCPFPFPSLPTVEVGCMRRVEEGTNQQCLCPSPVRGTSPTGCTECDSRYRVVVLDRDGRCISLRNCPGAALCHFDRGTLLRRSAVLRTVPESNHGDPESPRHLTGRSPSHRSSALQTLQPSSIHRSDDIHYRYLSLATASSSSDPPSSTSPAFPSWIRHNGCGRGCRKAPTIRTVRRRRPWARLASALARRDFWLLQ
jgi:hypothetical protein